MKYWMMAALAVTSVTLLSTSVMASRVGIGVGIEGANLYSGEAGGGFSALYFPVELSNVVMLEPRLSYARVSSGASSTDAVVALGVGVLFGTKVDNTMPYGGFRVGLAMTSSTSSWGSSDSETYLLAPVFGGAYWLSEALSLGVEARLNLLYAGEGESNAVYTSSEFVARYFF